MGFVMLGGLLGFLCAVLSVTVFDAGWLAALAFWVAGGPVGVVAAQAAVLWRSARLSAEGHEAPELREAA